MSSESLGYFALGQSKSLSQSGERAVERDRQTEATRNCKNGVCELSTWKPSKPSVIQDPADGVRRKNI